MTVVVYSKPACQMCNATDRRMTQKGVEAVHVVLGDTPTDEAIRLELGAQGFQQMPIVKVYADDGAVISAWSGFDPDRIDALVTEQAA